jgi:predicted NUDIX family NTP pyrophosphohydrolase
MPSIAAGLLMYKMEERTLHFFLVHPGGPLYARRNEGVWSIPKGMPEDNEDLLEAAKREFEEETGLHPAPPFHTLGTIKQKGGKTVHAWAFEGSWDPQDGIVSNMFDFQWPPRSGKYIRIPEVDRASWFTYDDAVRMINPAQIPLLEKAQQIFDVPTHTSGK